MAAIQLNTTTLIIIKLVMSIQPQSDLKMPPSIPFFSTAPDLVDTINRESESGQKESNSTKGSQGSNPDIPQLKIKRVPHHFMNYSAYLFAAAMLPLLNLLILFTQSYNLSWENNFASIDRKNFEYYYIGITYYSCSIVIFLLATANTDISLKDMIRLYILMDSNQICVIASNICYVSLHIIYLCSDVSGGTYQVYPVDIVYLTVFVINNFAFMGHFRVSLVHYKWSYKETLTFKILVFLSSLSYFAYGILIIIGQDTLSILLNQANNIIQNFIQTTDFGNLTSQVQSELIQQMNQLSGNISVIQNLINLFVFTSFANICEVLSRMNDFDKSSQLQPGYEIDDQEDQQPKLQNLKVEFDHKFIHLQKQLNNMMIIKETIKNFIPPLPNLLMKSSLQSHTQKKLDIPFQQLEIQSK